VVKAQVHAGGRGKAGGVKLQRADEASEVAGRILGMNLVSKQTGRARFVAKCSSRKRLECARALPRGSARSRRRASGADASKFGGMEIEEVAAEHPRRSSRSTSGPLAGLQAYQARKLGFALNFGGHLQESSSSSWPRSPAPTTRATQRWPRSTRCSSRPTATCSRSTPR